jgi:hypothetical protein
LCLTQGQATAFADKDQMENIFLGVEACRDSIARCQQSAAQTLYLVQGQSTAFADEEIKRFFWGGFKGCRDSIAWCQQLTVDYGFEANSCCAIKLQVLGSRKYLHMELGRLRKLEAVYGIFVEVRKKAFQEEI